MSNQAWSFLVTGVGVIGFILAGRKIWWAWYVNLFCQVLWLGFALVSGLYGFLIGTAVYTVVFSQNAYKWTKQHLEERHLKRVAKETLDSYLETMIVYPDEVRAEEEWERRSRALSESRLTSSEIVPIHLRETLPNDGPICGKENYLFVTVHYENVTCKECRAMMPWIDWSKYAESE